MPDNYKNKKFLSIWGLFVLLLMCNSTEYSNGSGVSDPIVKKASFVNAETEGEFSAISYNIAGLPAFICSAKTPRASSIADIGKKLESFDIIHVQEDFNYHSQLYENDNVHNYRTQTKGAVPFGDGLNTLSKYPITHVVRVKWNNCTGADCLTPKGFTYSKIQLAEHVFVDFYNVHSNAYNTLNAASARRENIKQLSDYIKKHSAGNAVILMGDLNGRYCYFLDNIHILNSKNGLQDAWISHKKNGKTPAALKSIPAADILSLTDSCETIDKIFFRSSPAIELKTTSYSFLNRSFNNKEGKPLSDHHPVSAKFAWRIRPSNEYLADQRPGAHSVN